MDKTQRLLLLEDMLGLPPRSLTGAERLRDLHEWDSLATLDFIAMIDKRFGIPLPASRVTGCQTVEELIALMGALPLAA